MKTPLLLAAALLVTPAVLRAEDPAAPAPGAPAQTAPAPAPAPAATPTPTAEPAEKSTAPAPEKHSRVKALRARLLKRLDADQDGKLSPEERTAAKTEFQAKAAALREKARELFDADKDGKLSEEERATAKEALRTALEKRASKKKAANGADNAVAEARQKMAATARRKVLEKFDTDRDGQLSETERAQLREARKARTQP
ncbi:MAG: putative signal transduction protein with EFhand domain [Verrucomicrobiales bacterium]|nr:putative signal transduction protein with EFhand domain [Verrucomicrobiales bacterium]